MKFKMEITGIAIPELTSITVRFTASNWAEAGRTASDIRSEWLRAGVYAKDTVVEDTDDVPPTTSSAYLPPVDNELLTRIGKLYGFPPGTVFYYDHPTHRFTATALEEYPGIPLEVYLSYYERKHGGVL